MQYVIKISFPVLDDSVSNLQGEVCGFPADWTPSSPTLHSLPVHSNILPVAPGYDLGHSMSLPAACKVFISH